MSELDDAIAACNEERAERVALCDADKLAGARAERDELLARCQLLERREEALRLVAQLRPIHVLEVIVGALTTNKLSREQKKLADQLVTQRICQELVRARKDLGVRSLYVELDPVARKGRALVKLVLQSSRPWSRSWRPSSRWSRTAGEGGERTRRSRSTRSCGVARWSLAALSPRDRA